MKKERKIVVIIVTALIVLGFIVSMALHVNNSSKLFKKMQAEKEILHNKIIAEHIRSAEYADSLHNVAQINIQSNKEQAKATSAKVDANFKTTLKLLKQRQDEERNNVMGTSIDSTISNVRRYFPD